MKGKVVVIALAAILLLGISVLIALMGMQTATPVAFLPAGTSPADLPEPGSKGAQLVARHCQSCHSVPLPILHTADEWPRVLDDMAGRMMSRVMAPLPIPSPDDTRELVQYLKRNARGASAVAHDHAAGAPVHDPAAVDRSAHVDEAAVGDGEPHDTSAP